MDARSQWTCEAQPHTQALIVSSLCDVWSCGAGRACCVCGTEPRPRVPLGLPSDEDAGHTWGREVKERGGSEGENRGDNDH